jgi:hypothetical protein
MRRLRHPRVRLRPSGLFQATRCVANVSRVQFEAWAGHLARREALPEAAYPAAGNEHVTNT